MRLYSPRSALPLVYHVAMRVERYFGFLDLSGFTRYTDTEGDARSMEVVTAFRIVTRQCATDFAVRIAKWLGDGCMVVSVDPELLVQAVLELDGELAKRNLPLKLHGGLAGGPVLILEGDDYIGGAVNLAARLCDVADPGQILATPKLASFAPRGSCVDQVGDLRVPGITQPVPVVALKKNG